MVREIHASLDSGKNCGVNYFNHLQNEENLFEICFRITKNLE